TSVFTRFLELRSCGKSLVKKPAYQVHEGCPLLGPGMCTINLLPAFGGFGCLLRMQEDVFDLRGKLFGVSGFEVEQGIGVEVVLDAWRPWSNHRFTQRQILEDASRSVDVGERVALVGDHSHITVFNR